MIITNLLTNMVVLALGGALPTNTPAFQAYAFHTMFTNAQVLAAKWSLDQELIATNRVTLFSAKASRSGVCGVIVFDHHYAFEYLDGRLTGFSDLVGGGDFLYSGDKKQFNATMKKWLAATNVLSLQKVGEVACSALSSIGLQPETMGAASKPIGTRAMAQWNDDTVFLPYYYFEWKSNRRSVVTVHVSGMDGKIKYLENRLPFRLLDKPANYLEMLGLPTNAVFVMRRYTPPSKPQEYEVLQP